jgi:hypothetical protein
LGFFLSFSQKRFRTVIDLEKFSAEPTISLLRDFQRRTVEHVVSRLYDPDNPSLRFLVADEVGLGKTMVARGVIARTVERLRDKVKRIDVIYVCSNAAIARQNIRRLNPVPGSEVNLATRLTLLPLHFADREFGNDRFNFVSFTPGTSLDLASRSGTAKERALICWMLEDGGFKGAGLRNFLQASAGREQWNARLNARKEYDSDLAEKFVKRVRNDQLLASELNEQSDRFGYWRPVWPREFAAGRYRLIGILRHQLAITCLRALEPDLIILDEFQRFKGLLTGESEAARLAGSLFSYASETGDRARTLLLSATPYRMPLQQTEDKGDHYQDFVATLGFLYNDAGKLGDVESALGQYRAALHQVETNGQGSLHDARDAVQRLLLQVMVRTERVGDTNALDAMVRERPCQASVCTEDLRLGALLDQIAVEVKARGSVEYWKSAAFPLAFMSKYEIVDKLRTSMAKPSPRLHGLLSDLQKLQPKKSQMRNYTQLSMANGRLRALSDQTIEAGLVEALWLPPSLPYYGLAEPWSGLSVHTKALVFSEWDLAPNGIAALLSYEAERRIREAAAERVGRLSYQEFGRHRGGLRPLRLDEGRPAEMSQFTVLYPCVALAREIDPLMLHASSLEQARAQAEKIARSMVEKETGSLESGGREDVSWHWAMLARLDLGRSQILPNGRFDRKTRWLGAEEEGTGDISGVARDHLRLFAAAGSPSQPLGPHPVDLASVLADIALGSPAVCALRALHRVLPRLAWDDPDLVCAAGRVAHAFRSLFSRPESALLLASRNKDDLPFWRQVLRYCAEGNLQAVLDEYAHILVEALGLFGNDGKTDDGVKAARIAEEMADALTLRAARIEMHQLKTREGGFFDDPHSVRCRFAMRLGELRDETGGTTRLEQVRQAFNSPFWPFVLASTSVGQEGLDFHPYCHSVWHWNLPSSPVDLEQREGRVHRYKGHAVRRNLAKRYGDDVLGKSNVDPWAEMFTRAREDNVDRSELIPYWVFEVTDGVSVERNVPNLPFSREIEKYGALQRTLALYRLAFGQPRQEDLIRWLDDRFGNQALLETLTWRIDLSPPVFDLSPEHSSRIG